MSRRVRRNAPAASVSTLASCRKRGRGQQVNESTVLFPAERIQAERLEEAQRFHPFVCAVAPAEVMGQPDGVLHRQGIEDRIANGGGGVSSKVARRGKVKAVAGAQEAKRAFLHEIQWREGASEDTVRAWLKRKANRLPSYRVGREFRVRVKDFDVWLQSHQYEDKEDRQ